MTSYMSKYQESVSIHNPGISDGGDVLFIGNKVYVGDAYKVGISQFKQL